MWGINKRHQIAFLQLIFSSFLIFSCVENNKKKTSKKSVSANIPTQNQSQAENKNETKIEKEDLIPESSSYIKELEGVLKSRAKVYFIENKIEQETLLTLKFEGKDLESMTNARFLLIKYIEDLKVIKEKEKLTPRQTRWYQILNHKISLAEQLLDKVNLEFQTIYK